MDATRNESYPDARILAEAHSAVLDYVATDEETATAMVLYAAATHALRAFPAFGRFLFTGDRPGCGKSSALMVTSYLSSNPVNVGGGASKYALTATLAAQANTPEQPPATFYRDEISSVFGRSGLNTASGSFVEVLREGYKRSATSMWSVARNAETFSIYAPVLMAGNGTAVPMDVRTRSVVAKLAPGRPRRDLDDDGQEDRLREIGKVLGGAVRSALEDVKAFRAYGLDPELTGRAHQVWRPLLAVASALGGPAWLAKALASFRALALSDVQAPLSPDQRVLRDITSAVAGRNPRDFVGGNALAEDLSETEGWEGRTPNSLTHDIARAMPVEPQRRLVGDLRVRGYFVSDIRAAWDAVRPPEPGEFDAPTEASAFDSDDDCDEDWEPLESDAVSDDEAAELSPDQDAERTTSDEDAERTTSDEDAERTTAVDAPESAASPATAARRAPRTSRSSNKAAPVRARRPRAASAKDAVRIE